MQIDIKIPKREIEIEGVRTGGVNTYTKEEIDNKDSAVLSEAKAYTDAETYTKAQIDQKDADTLNSAKGYSDTTAQGVVNTLRGEVATKQDILTAGSNINITNNEISADLSDYYTKSEVDNKDTATLSSAKDYTDTKLTDYYTKTDTYTKTETNNLLNAKQDTLTAGNNITIDANNVIKAKERSWKKIRNITIDDANEGQTVDGVYYKSNGGNGVNLFKFSTDSNGNSLVGKGIISIATRLTPTTAININQGFVRFNENYVTRYFTNIKNTTAKQYFFDSLNLGDQKDIMTGTTGQYMMEIVASSVTEITTYEFFGHENTSLLGQGSQFEIWAYGYWEEPTRNLAKGTKLEIVDDFPILTDEEIENLETDVSDTELNKIGNSEVEKDVSEIEKVEIEPETIEKQAK